MSLWLTINGKLRVKPGQALERCFDELRELVTGMTENGSVKRTSLGEAEEIEFAVDDYVNAEVIADIRVALEAFCPHLLEASRIVEEIDGDGKHPMYLASTPEQAAAAKSDYTLQEILNRLPLLTADDQDRLVEAMQSPRTWSKP